MNAKMISGRKRKLTSFIEPFQQRVVQQWVPKVPPWLETYHLTLLTMPLSLGVILLGYLARMSLWWLVGISVLVFLQYVTDILDGAVGRYRKTGLILWGFYMDHFSDYIFACSLVGAYTIAYHLPAEVFWVASVVTSGIFIHEFLACIAKGDLNTSGYYGFGPSEIRLIGILMNVFLPLIPKDFIVSAISAALPFSFAIFAWLIFREQKFLWAQDMKNKDGK